MGVDDDRASRKRETSLSELRRAIYAFQRTTNHVWVALTAVRAEI